MSRISKEYVGGILTAYCSPTILFEFDEQYVVGIGIILRTKKSG